jgi:hypothetical protein
VLAINPRQLQLLATDRFMGTQRRNQPPTEHPASLRLPQRYICFDVRLLLIYWLGPKVSVDQHANARSLWCVRVPKASIISRHWKFKPTSGVRDVPGQLEDNLIPHGNHADTLVYIGRYIFALVLFRLSPSRQDLNILFPSNRILSSPS